MVTDIGVKGGKGRDDVWGIFIRRGKKKKGKKLKPLLRIETLQLTSFNSGKGGGKRGKRFSGQLPTKKEKEKTRIEHKRVSTGGRQKRRGGANARGGGLKLTGPRKRKKGKMQEL